MSPTMMINDLHFLLLWLSVDFGPVLVQGFLCALQQPTIAVLCFTLLTVSTHTEVACMPAVMPAGWLLQDRHKIMPEEWE